MKTSKIILVSFLSAVSLFLLSFMITVDKKKYNKEFEKAEETFSKISVIKASKGVNATFTTGDQNLISISFYKDSTYKMPYKIIGDTLVLKSHLLNGNNFHFKVSVNTPVKEFINDGGSITSKVKQDSININNSNEGYFHIHKDSPVIYTRLYSQEQSRTIIESNAIKELNMQVSNAHVSINKPIPNVILKAENNANITMKQAFTLSANCDETSQYNIY